MIDTTRLRIASRLAMLAIFCAVRQAYALPPLGLTQITSSNTSAGLEIIDGRAYLNVTNGVWTVDSLGTKSFVSITHPSFGTPTNVTRVVKASDDGLHVAANFPIHIPGFGFFSQPALYRLDAPSLPIVTWDSGRATGVDSNLVVFGNLEDIAALEATQFFLNGTYQPLLTAGGSAYLTSSAPSGYALGNAHIPGTLGSAPGVWTPTGEFSFLDGSNTASSIRDREDGIGVNASWDLPAIKYGNAAPLFIEVGPLIEVWVVVSHSDFAIVQDAVFPEQSVKYAFYPGINPDHPDRALPLLDIFPQLATIDIDFISDLASEEGYLYMTLSGSDGTFLFGARDPSVIPEPTPALLLLTALPYLVRRNSWIAMSRNALASRVPARALRPKSKPSIWPQNSVIMRLCP